MLRLAVGSMWALLLLALVLFLVAVLVPVAAFASVCFLARSAVDRLFDVLFEGA